MRRIHLIFNFFIILVFLIVLTSCRLAGESQNDGVIQNGSHKIQYKFNYNIEDDNYKQIANSVNNKVYEFAGYVYESVENNNMLYYTYKIPSSESLSFSNYLDSLDCEKSKTEYTNDITITFNILEERILTLNSKKVAYNDELNKPNLTLDEKLKINDMIDELNNQIYILNVDYERMKNEIDFSTFSIYYKEANSFWNSFGKITLKLLNYVLITLSISLPFAILALIIIFIVKRKNISKQN